MYPSGNAIVGMKFKDEDKAYEFYKTYASEMGFDVKKFKTKLNSKWDLGMKQFVCNKPRKSNSKKNEEDA